MRAERETAVLAPQREDAVSFVPHEIQNAASATFALPQFGQPDSTLAPQRMQKEASSGFWWPQAEQSTAGLPSVIGQWE